MRTRDVLALKLEKAVAFLISNDQSGKMEHADWLDNHNCPAI
jgi:hypothetical protein